MERSSWLTDIYNWFIAPTTAVDDQLTTITPTTAPIAPVIRTPEQAAYSELVNAVKRRVKTLYTKDRTIIYIHDTDGNVAKCMVYFKSDNNGVMTVSQGTNIILG